MEEAGRTGEGLQRCVLSGVTQTCGLWIQAISSVTAPSLSPQLPLYMRIPHLPHTLKII